jgi:hypothetical protein
MERAIHFGEKAVLTDSEVAELEELKARFDAAKPEERPVIAPGTFTTARIAGDRIDEQAVSSEWFDIGTKVVKGNRTSLIVDPSDGRIPYRPEARAAAQSRKTGTDNPEDRPFGDRCLVSMNAGPPIRPSAYNNNVQILQTGDYIAILNEMIHDLRVVPLDGRPPLPSQIRQWRGDARGRWEDDTLIIETSNFTGRGLYAGGTENTVIVERFRRVGPDTLEYEFTVSDPTVYTKPWTAVLPMTRSSEQIFEYACHEGNYAMGNILRGARVQEGVVGSLPSTERRK